jgi:hypothetical protein
VVKISKATGAQRMLSKGQRGGKIGKKRFLPNVARRKSLNPHTFICFKGVYVVFYELYRQNFKRIANFNNLFATQSMLQNAWFRPRGGHISIKKEVRQR